MVSDSSNGIYRGVIAALIGVILIGAAPKDGGKEAGKNTHTKTEIGKSAPTIAASSTDPVQIIQRPIMERPCDEGRDNRQSDLCAQWKAADAASKAAWWAMIATFVTALGTFGLFWQIKLTREAVQDTGKATEAMEAANNLAVMAQRAWVFVDDVKILDHTEGTPIRVIFKNYGQYPAPAFASEVVARNMRYPFWAQTLERASNDFMIMNLAPGQSHEREVWDFRVVDSNGQRTRISISWSYYLPDKTSFDAFEDWVVIWDNGAFYARRILPIDSINHSKNTDYRS
jgi:hypothetical protein